MDEAAHLREMVQKLQSQVKELEVSLHRSKEGIKHSVEYLTFLSDNESLTKNEHNLIEMVLNYLRG